MTRAQLQYLKSESGYTLIEVTVAAAIGAILMGALVSVLLTTTRAAATATSRVEASSQIRNFEFYAYEDFAGASVSDLAGGCTPSVPCASQPINLTVTEIGNPPNTYQVTYSWDQTQLNLQRQVGSNEPLDAATNVSKFTWYIDNNQTVVVSLTIKVGAYAESQTFRFFPRRNP